jgi:hypothetical protein
MIGELQILELLKNNIIEIEMLLKKLLKHAKVLEKIYVNYHLLVIFVL